MINLVLSSNILHLKYFLHLSYHGGDYHGWQRQINARSVQEVFEHHLSKLLKKKTHVIGCGRTDTGVHASQYFAHIKVDDPLHEEFVFRINKILPDSIAVNEVIEVDRKAHAQHDATTRSYSYYLHLDKNPLIGQLSTGFDLNILDIPIMQEALHYVLQNEDFHVLCRNPKVYKSTICHMHEAAITVSDDGQRVKMHFTADRFLRTMVRLLVSKILKIGTKKLDLNDFKNHLSTRRPFPHFDPSPPQGLHLTKVVYPFLQRPNTRNLLDF